MLQRLSPIECFANDGFANTWLCVVCDNRTDHPRISQVNVARKVDADIAAGASIAGGDISPLQKYYSCFQTWVCPKCTKRSRSALTVFQACKLRLSIKRTSDSVFFLVGPTRKGEADAFLLVAKINSLACSLEKGNTDMMKEGVDKLKAWEISNERQVVCFPEASKQSRQEPAVFDLQFKYEFKDNSTFYISAPQISAPQYKVVPFALRRSAPQYKVVPFALDHVAAIFDLKRAKSQLFVLFITCVDQGATLMTLEVYTQEDDARPELNVEWEKCMLTTHMDETRAKLHAGIREVDSNMVGRRFTDKADEGDDESKGAVYEIKEVHYDEEYHCVLAMAMDTTRSDRSPEFYSTSEVRHGWGMCLLPAGCDNEESTNQLISPYEQARNERVNRNNEFMRGLVFAV